MRTADERIAAAGEAREKARLQARTREAEAAQRQAAAAESAAAQAQQRADAAAATAGSEAARRAQLEAELRELQAQQTQRGLVVTLGDVLFDTGRAELRAGALRAIDRLAAFLQSNPQRRIVIEGHTDNTGGGELNLALSERRAAAVRDALLARGIESERVIARGLGESYPLATNDTAVGRQQNRRVEIVRSDQTGRVLAR